MVGCMTQQAHEEIPDDCDLTPEKLEERKPPAIQMMERATGIEDEVGGTLVRRTCGEILSWVKLEDNEAGTVCSLQNLARMPKSADA